MKKNKTSKKNSFSTKEVSFLVIMTCVLSFAMAGLIFTHKKSKVEYIEDSNLSLFLKQYNYIVDNYYETVDKKELIDGAIMGMLYSLDDPYAEYYDEASANTFNARLNGSFEGVGIEIINIPGSGEYVLDVFEGSSAYEAGLKPGDLIVEIDNQDVSKMTIEEFLEFIRNSNSSIKIKVVRENEKLEFKLTKRHVTLKSVETKVLDDNIGYIKINIFAINTYSQFNDALNDLTKQDIKALVIDLRGNPGGHLTTAEHILSLLINKDKVIYQINNQGKQEKYYSKGTKNYQLPIAVIVDGDSASASELITSALMEQLGAIVVGQKTYGKGTVQELVDLPSGNQYKITTKQWLTSEGNELEGKGVMPSIEIKGKDDDSYFDAAIKELKKKIQ